MSLFAIGDLHLHFQSELKAPGQLRDPVWRNHEVKFRQNCEKLIKDDDTLVLAGDHSWGKKLPECEKDLEYICSLPDVLNQQYAGKLFFLQNNYAAYEDYAIVGSKGYTFEGPFYMRGNKIVGWDGVAESIAVKRIERETERLKLSFEAAIKDGYSRFIMFLHYPPTNVMERNSNFTAMADKYKVEQVIYAHCHGEHRFHDSIEGRHHGIMYRLVSGDYLKWIPLRIL